MFKKIMISLVSIVVFSASLYAQTALEIMTKSDNLPRPNNARSKAEMSVEKSGQIDKKSIEIMAINAGKNDKVLATIKEEPSGDITKILTHTNKGGEDLQWLKMPNGRVKRITTADRSGAFVNSHLFYEDMRSRDINDSTYKLVGEEKVESFDCYRIEAIPKPGKSIYDKAVFFVIKSGEFQYFVVRADIFFDGYLYKRLINYDIKMVNGIITPYRAVMYRIHRNGDTLGNTEVKIKAIQYNNPAVTDALFNQGRL